MLGGKHRDNEDYHAAKRVSSPRLCGSGAVRSARAVVGAIVDVDRCLEPTQDLLTGDETADRIAGSFA